MCVGAVHLYSGAMRPTFARLTVIGIGALALWSAAGCSKPLFSPKEERSPFDRFNEVRNQQVPQTVEDEFGRRRPNLRARLTPKG